LEGVYDVRTVARKIEKALLPSFSLEGLSLGVEASIGAVLYPDHGSDADTLLQRADIAMYIAKQKGKEFALYATRMDQHSPRRLTLMGELRQSVEDDELMLYYQPKLERASGRVVGVEALVRWRHKEHGIMAPDDFIPLAERTGLINQLTHWVLENALRQATLWQGSGIEVGIAVNLSTRNLLDPEFPDRIAGLLASHDYPPGRLTLEITETSIMADPELALEILRRIAAMGVRFAIDDFGTGYSSLAYLKRLPVSEIKIDKSFVMEMCESENDAVIVKATIDLGHNLGLQVVAEGVENEETMERLGALGCDLLQGHFIRLPLTATEFARWYQREVQPVGGD
jgi:EAL domain-containing protein (putative c-di-GMP-specific phosphodiesterase class I)